MSDAALRARLAAEVCGALDNPPLHMEAWVVDLIIREREAAVTEYVTGHLCTHCGQCTMTARYEVCETCGEDLRGTGLERLREAAKLEERTRVVSWLRDKGFQHHASSIWDTTADSIEAGEHEESGDAD